MMNQQDTKSDQEQTECIKDLEFPNEQAVETKAGTYLEYKVDRPG